MGFIENFRNKSAVVLLEELEVPQVAELIRLYELGRNIPHFLGTKEEYEEFTGEEYSYIQGMPEVKGGIVAYNALSKYFDYSRNPSKLRSLKLINSSPHTFVHNIYMEAAKVGADAIVRFQPKQGMYSMESGIPVQRINSESVSTQEAE